MVWPSRALCDVFLIFELDPLSISQRRVVWLSVEMDEVVVVGV